MANDTSTPNGKKGAVDILGDFAESVTQKATDVFDSTRESIDRSKTSIIKAIDQNGNEEIDIEDIIILGLQAPGVKIDRTTFLQQEFLKKYPQHMVDKAIASTPAQAGIPSDEIDKIADSAIQYERYFVSGIAAALGAPGGFAMVATIPADIMQYYGYMLRATQKLLYLYGFPEIDITEKNSKFDSETINILILCLGVMYGAAGANNALKAVAKAFAAGLEKKLLKMALTKGTIYPVVKSVATWFGKSMTKQVFAGFFKKAIPVVGGVIGGGITYLSFKPCCDKLKGSLQDTWLSNPDRYQFDSIGAIDIDDLMMEEDTEKTPC